MGSDKKIMFNGVEVSYTVFSSVHRFTGDYALTKAIRWARLVKAGSHDGHYGTKVTIKNEMNVVIGTF